MKTVLSGRVLWSYDYGLPQRDPLSELGAQFSGINPFHTHSGEIVLTNYKRDEELTIPLGNLDQIYLRFDDIFPRTLVKNFGGHP